MHGLRLIFGTLTTFTQSLRISSCTGAPVPVRIAPVPHLLWVWYNPQKAPPTDPAAQQSAKRRKLHTYMGPEPTVAEIEAEFWRIVETPDNVYESLYGQVQWRLRSPHTPTAWLGSSWNPAGACCKSL